MGWGVVSISTALAGTAREYKERRYAERANGSAGKRGACKVIYFVTNRVKINDFVTNNTKIHDCVTNKAKIRRLSAVSSAAVWYHGPNAQHGIGLMEAD